MSKQYNVISDPNLSDLHKSVVIEEIKEVTISKTISLGQLKERINNRNQQISLLQEANSKDQLLIDEIILATNLDPDKPLDPPPVVIPEETIPEEPIVEELKV